MRRRKRKTVSGLVKTIPLSIALTALSTGTAFAAPADSDNKVQVEVAPGQYYQFDLSRAGSDATYAAAVKSYLTKAFEEGSEILIYDTDSGKWIDFGANAGAGVTLTDMKAGVNDNASYEGVPDNNPLIYEI
jgi:hypothetical protein